MEINPLIRYLSADRLSTALPTDLRRTFFIKSLILLDTRRRANPILLRSDFNGHRQWLKLIFLEVTHLSETGIKWRDKPIKTYLAILAKVPNRLADEKNWSIEIIFG